MKDQIAHLRLKLFIITDIRSDKKQGTWKSTDYKFL